MNSLKPLIMVAVLAGIGYGVYVRLNRGVNAPPPPVAAGWDSSPSVQLPDQSGAAPSNSGAAAGPGPVGPFGHTSLPSADGGGQAPGYQPPGGAENAPMPPMPGDAAAPPFDAAAGAAPPHDPAAATGQPQAYDPYTAGQPAPYPGAPHDPNAAHDPNAPGAAPSYAGDPNQPPTGPYPPGQQAPEQYPPGQYPPVDASPAGSPVGAPVDVAPSGAAQGAAATDPYTLQPAGDPYGASGAAPPQGAVDPNMAAQGAGMPHDPSQPAPPDAASAYPAGPADPAAASAYPQAGAPEQGAPPTDPNAPSAAGAPAGDFTSAVQAAQRELEAGQMASALRQLSQWCGNPQLTPEQQHTLYQMLDQVAGTVVYSTQNLLEPPYEVQQGERLEDIGDRYHVPWQLLAKINGINDPSTLKPGERLKVLRGPFQAVVSLDKRELTLLTADGSYAGRFKIGVGAEHPPQLGTFPVSEKVVNPVYYGRDRAIGAEDAANPLGERWIGLGKNLGIHGTNDPGNVGRNDLPGSISLTERDAEDVYDILSLGSRVTIRR